LFSLPVVGKHIQSCACIIIFVCLLFAFVVVFFQGIGVLLV